MFGFWKSDPKDDPRRKQSPQPARPPGPAPKKRTRIVDVPGLIRQASNKIRIKQLLEMGKKDITLLSREKIEDLINRSVRSAVEKHLAKGPVTGASLARIQEDSRAQFAELFRKAKFTANISDDPTRDLLKLIKSFTTHVPAAKNPAIEVSGSERRIVSFQDTELELGRGLDVGTVNICAGARKLKSGETLANIQRSAFLELRGDPLTQAQLSRFGVDFIPREDKSIVIGDPAFDLANLFEHPVRRALKDGTIARDEPQALFVVNCLVTQLLGRPQKEGEVCVYSVPADSVDADRSFIYHRSALDIMLRNLGYTPKAMLESHLIVFAELKEQAYTGIGISCGAGMFNVCVSYKGVPAVTFSTPRGGDWIDDSVADSLGLTAPLVAAVKEGGMDLRKPKGRVEEAIAIYYRHLIQYTLGMMQERMGQAATMPTFQKPVEIVCSGGTAMAPGFIEMFREEFTKMNLPVPVSEIRTATNPMKAVTVGCVQAAIEESRAPGQNGVQIAPAALERSAAHDVQKVDVETQRRLEAMHRPPPRMGRAAPAEVQQADAEVQRRLAEISRPPSPVERDAPVVQEADAELQRRLAAAQRAPSPSEREAPIVQAMDAETRARLASLSRRVTAPEREAPIVQEADAAARRRLEEMTRPPAPLEREAPIVQEVDADAKRRLEALTRPSAPPEREAPIVQKADPDAQKRLEEMSRPPGPIEREAPVVRPADAEVKRRLEAMAHPAPPPEREEPVVVKKTWQTHNGKVSPGPAV